MATRNKRKLAILNKENCEEHPSNNLAQNSNVPRSQADYITQVSEEFEGRVTKNSQDFSRMENRILGALARLDDFLMNPLLQGHSGTTPEMSRNVFSINQGMNEDDSQSDPQPEAGLLNSGREDRHDMATWVQRENVMGHDTCETKEDCIRGVINDRCLERFKDFFNRQIGFVIRQICPRNALTLKTSKKWISSDFFN